MRFPLLSKTLAIGAVVLLLCLVLARIDSLVAERSARQEEARRSVEQSMAGAQVLMGPLLLRHCTEEWEFTQGEGRDRRVVADKRSFTLTSAPQTLAVDGEARADARYRGLFKVNGYAGPIELEARWASLSELQPRAEHANGRLQCEPAVVMLSVSDVRGLRSARVRIDGETTPVEPGTGHPAYPRGLHAVLSEARLERANEPLAVKLSIDLLGTVRLSLVPAAGETRWSLRSDWPHPSFGGRFLPATREVSESGFAAQWSVSSLASSAAKDVQHGGVFCSAPPSDELGYAAVARAATASTQPAQPCLDLLSVDFIDPINPYVLTDRATKYALLFIALTFAGVALVEVLARRRVHPVQYALVGMALALFYLLLLSLSEHMGFGAAYALAASACVALLGFYASHMLGRRAAGAAFGLGAAALYGLLWVLLRMEQTALVIGSVMLFAALAAVMVLTRRIDWYALVDSWRADPAGAAKTRTAAQPPQA
ncbi:cell envelope integrity protein CreD [Caldimonas sp. KR1-144]|uniref:cell envelope integrity protein CreD n=1 Tax=Caldimonas sp. KR1-144 TaxID=3400911 RepID=UPI003C0BCDFB